MGGPDRSSPLPKVMAAIGLLTLLAAYFFYSRSEKSRPIDAAAPNDAIANSADFTGPSRSANALANAASSAPEMPQLDRARADAVREKLRALPPIPYGESNALAPHANNGGANYPVMPDDDFIACVKESMMAISFDAPPNDGHVDRKSTRLNSSH